MPRANFYDVIIIGGQPAALMAGGLLRRRNYRTLLIQQGPLNNSYLYDGMSLPAVPTMLPPRGHSPVFEQVLQSMGMEDPLHILGNQQPQTFQVVTPEQRIEISSEIRVFEVELERAFPEEKPQILRVLGRIKTTEEHYSEYLQAQTTAPSRGIRKSAKLKRVLRALKQFSPPDIHQWPLLLRILAAGTTFTTNVDYQTRSIFTTGHLVLGLLGGLRNVPSFQLLLSEAFRKIGGELEPDTIVEEIDFDGRNPAGITTLRRSMTYKCTTLLAALPIRHTLELIPLRKRRRRLRLATDSVRPSLSLFTINFMLPQESLPMGMGKHLFMVRNPSEPLVEDNLLRILCLPIPERPDSVLVNFSCLIPSRKRSLGREYLETIRQRIHEAAAWLIPFFQRHLQGQSSPFLNPTPDADSSSQSPWKLHQALETDQHKSLNETVVPLSTPYRSLFFCGPEAMPALGLEGAAQAARDVVNLISEQNKLKKIL